MSYRLSTSQLDPILEKLEARYREAQPGALQVIGSRLLMLATLGLVVTYLLYLTGVTEQIELALAWVGLMTLFLLLSWRYVPSVKRQRALYRELDLAAPEATPGGIWKNVTARQQRLVRGAVVVALAAVVGGIVWQSAERARSELPTLLGMLCLLSALGYFLWSDRRIPLELAERMLGWLYYGLAVWGAVAVYMAVALSQAPECLAPECVAAELPRACPPGCPWWQEWIGLLLVVWWPAWLLLKSRQVARIDERFAPIRNAGALHRNLEHRRREATEAGSDSVELTAAEVTQLAYAEREVIRQARVDAISDSRAEGTRWTVFVADGVKTRVRELAPEEQLAVQNAIASLSLIDEADAEGAGEGQALLAVEGTSLRLRYWLVRARHRVSVLELISPEPSTDE